jgi:hypothetical protein
MAFEMSTPPNPLLAEALFTPGPRLGWVFRDRHVLAVPYPEPAPDPRAIAARVAGQAAAAEQALARSRNWVARPSVAAALLIVVLAGYAKVTTGSYHVGVAALAIIVVCLPGLGFTGWCWRRRDRLRVATGQEEYVQARAAWEQRASGHEAAEAARLAGQPVWGSLNAPEPRTDVFGGTLAGWRGLLTVHGASLLAQRPVLVADLSGQHAARQLVLTAREAGIPVTGFRLPRDLGRSGMLADLSPGQLAVAIAEAIHPGDPNGSRTERALDVRVLEQLAGALAGRGVTPRRLAAAVRMALGTSVPDGELAADEIDVIAGDLFPTGYREQVMTSLVRLDAVLADLASYASDGRPDRPARLTCLVMDPAARSASGEVLTSLLVQWLTVQVSAGPIDQPAPAVIVTGADEVPRAHAERLSDVCELRGVPLTLMFRHLRDDAATLLGGGTAAFMRLGNHAEAEQAATYIGRRHTFVVSSFTVTQGGSLTVTRGTSDSYGTGTNTSVARSSGWSDVPGGPLSGNAHSGGRTGTTGTSTSRTVGTNWSQGDGTNWSDAQARQRVYEFAVEPTILQGLPEHALLVTDRSGAGPRLQAVECDPSIVSLPGVSMAPLPPAARGEARAALGQPAPALTFIPRDPPGDLAPPAPRTRKRPPRTLGSSGAGACQPRN